MGLTIPAVHLRTVLDTATERGASAAALCAALSLDEDKLEDPTARLPLEVATALYDLAAKSTSDVAFGLHVAERSDYFAFDALGFAITTKRTLREAFEHLSAMIQALHGTKMELVTDATGARLSFELPEEPTQPCRHRTEAYMARIVRLVELATGVRPRVLGVRFRHREPPNIAEHIRLFASKPVFGAPQNELIFEASTLEAPLVRADERLSGILDQHLRDLVAKTPVVQTLADQVRRYVREAFPHGDFGVEAIGRRTGLGARTLQRRLAEESTSHREILEQVRHELALRYLVETQMPIKEIAVVLGYSELRAFYRAFERWTGLPPAEYRRSAG